MTVHRSAYNNRLSVRFKYSSDTDEAVFRKTAAWLNCVIGKRNSYIYRKNRRIIADGEQENGDNSKV